MQKEISSIKYLRQAVSNGRRDLLDICLCVLNISYIDGKLKDELKIFLDGLSNPLLLTELSDYAQLKETRFESSKHLAQVKGLLQEEKEMFYRVIRRWNNQIQELLIWMIQAPVKSKEVPDAKQ